MYRFLGKKDTLYQLESESINIKLNYKCEEGTVEAGSFKCGNTPQEAKKNYEEQQKGKQKPSEVKADNGLNKIRAEIKKAGGAEKYFKTQIEPNAELLEQDYFKPVNQETLTKRFGQQLKHSKTIGNDNDIRFQELPNKTIIATVNGKVAGYIQSYKNMANQNETDLSVAVENQKSGLGTKLMMLFYNKNPEKIKEPGGFTIAGKNATLKLLKQIEKST